jgi:hypothetical protein
MKLAKMKDKAFLRLAKEEDNCSVSAGSMRGVFRKRESPAAKASVRLSKKSGRGAMTLKVTVPETAYRKVAELAARHEVSVERIVAAALAEQLFGWTRVEQIADHSSLERLLAALDKAPSTEPAPEDRPQPGQAPRARLIERLGRGSARQ